MRDQYSKERGVVDEYNDGVFLVYFRCYYWRFHIGKCNDADFKPKPSGVGLKLRISTRIDDFIFKLILFHLIIFFDLFGLE